MYTGGNKTMKEKRFYMVGPSLSLPSSPDVPFYSSGEREKKKEQKNKRNIGIEERRGKEGE